jgi:penicillin-binding protein activator
MLSSSSSSVIRSLAFTFVALSLPVLAVGCGPSVVRGSDDPSVDRAAVSTGLDKEDIKRALRDTLNKLRVAPVMNEWRTTNPPPIVAIFPFVNTSSAHVDSSMDTILSEAENWLLESNAVQVVSRQRQAEMIREVEGQQGAAFNPQHAARYGKQLGARYLITGKVSGNEERSDDMRRTQYFIYLQVLEAETSLIKFSAKSEISKAIK